jgi:hypothetical protein
MGWRAIGLAGGCRVWITGLFRIVRLDHWLVRARNHGIELRRYTTATGLNQCIRARAGFMAPAWGQPAADPMRAVRRGAIRMGWPASGIH